MEDTGLVGLLVAHHVGAPTQQGPEVHVGVRRVGDHAVTRSGDVGAAWQQGRGKRVVEGPGEGVGSGEALDTAAHLGLIYIITRLGNSPSVLNSKQRGKK